MKKILLVDDEKEILDLIEIYLKNEELAIVKAYDARSALAQIELSPPDLSILDIMLPDMDGLALCAEIRKNFTFPILMLTAKDTDMDKINGLTLGADDYITKPFNPLELAARVKAHLRRQEHYSGKPVNNRSQLEIEGLVINADSHTCSLYGKPLDLTPLEFSILWYLCWNANRVISSEELFEAVWREKYLDNNNTVMAHVARIREKMHEAPRKPKFIKTVWGVGYQVEQKQ